MTDRPKAQTYSAWGGLQLWLYLFWGCGGLCCVSFWGLGWGCLQLGLGLMPLGCLQLGLGLMPLQDQQWGGCCAFSFSQPWQSLPQLPLHEKSSLAHLRLHRQPCARDPLPIHLARHPTLAQSLPSRLDQPQRCTYIYIYIYYRLVSRKSQKIFEPTYMTSQPAGWPDFLKQDGSRMSYIILPGPVTQPLSVSLVRHTQRPLRSNPSDSLQLHTQQTTSSEPTHSHCI